MSDGARVGRRAFLASLAAAAAAGCDSARPHAGFLGRMERWNARVQGTLLDPYKLSPDPGAAALTPPGAFPVYFVGPGIPAAPPGWALRVGGLVARPQSFSVEDLARMPRTDMRVRHHCVEGWSAVASWHGVAVRELARIVGADPRAAFVEFRSFDAGYYSSWDRASALHPQTLLAYGMNGAPLSPAHGAPVRLYGAVKLGYKSVKYLTGVNFLPDMTGGYWENQGYEWFAGV